MGLPGIGRSFDWFLPIFPPRPAIRRWPFSLLLLLIFIFIDLHSYYSLLEYLPVYIHNTSHTRLYKCYKFSSWIHNTRKDLANKLFLGSLSFWHVFWNVCVYYPGMIRAFHDNFLSLLASTFCKKFIQGSGKSISKWRGYSWSNEEHLLIIEQEERNKKILKGRETSRG